MLGKDKNRTTGDRVVGLLDIGTSKICCLIAEILPGDRTGAGLSKARVLGVGHHRSRGIKSAVIVDLDEAEGAVRAAVGQAERMARLSVEEVYIGVACGRIKSSHFSAHAAVEGTIVTDREVARAVAAGRAFAERDGRTLVHLDRLGFRIDGHASVKEPRGMTGRRLTANLHAVTADDAPLRNLALLVERCHLTPVAMIAAGLASGLAVTSPDERRLGVTCLDIGGGATTITIFAEGQFIYTETIPVGGNHLTFDIARNLQTPLAEAERIKALYGTLVIAPSDDREFISYPLAGDEEQQFCQTTKAELRGIVWPRMDSMLGLVRERLEQSGIGRHAEGPVVLMGGASQLVGLTSFAADRLGRPVRMGRPVAVGGLPAGVCTPAFATVLGLLAGATMPDLGLAGYRERDALAAGYFGRMGQWLRESF